MSYLSLVIGMPKDRLFKLYGADFAKGKGQVKVKGIEVSSYQEIMEVRKMVEGYLI